MKKRVLITTIYTSNAIQVVINKISDIKEIIYLVEENPPREKVDAINDLKKFVEGFKGIMEVKELKTSLYDMPKIVQDITKKIDQISTDDTEIFVHISEGIKTLAFGLLFASYLKKDKVKGIYYVRKDNNELLALPVFNISLSESKKSILKEIIKNNKDIEKIRKNLELGKSAIYQYISELRQEGYIEKDGNKELNITDLGRIVVL